MCLGIPMQILRVDGLAARCTAKGEVRDIGLFLLADTPLVPGDWVLVSTGNAVQKLTEAEAASVWALLEEMLGLDEEAARA